MKISVALVALVASSSAAAYRLSLYSDTNYQGQQNTFTTGGTHNVGFTTRSWIWTSTVGDGCCVTFCRDRTNVGRFCGSASRSDSSAGVNKVVIGCGDDVLNC